MALTSSNVRVAVTGAVYVGATTTPAPTSHNSALDAGFKDLGYLSEDGITEARERTLEQFKAWQAATIVRTAVSEAGMTFQFVPWETKKTTIETFYGSSVTDGTGLITVDPASTGGRKSWVIDIIDGTDTIRWYIAEGEITEVGDVVYSNGTPIGYDLTLQAYTQPKRWESALIV